MKQIEAVEKANREENNHKERVKGLILDSPNGITSSQISTQVGVTPDSVRRLTKELIEEGEVEKVERKGNKGSLYLPK